MGDIKSVEKVLVGEWVISNESKIKLDFHGDLHWTTPSGRPPKSECSEWCPPGTRRSSTSPCCWQCLSCLGGPSAHLLVLKGAMNPHRNKAGYVTVTGNSIIL